MSSIRFLAAAVLAASLAVPAAAFAQTQPAAPVPATAGHHGHHNGMRNALRGLNLSASQRSQIDQIYAQAKGQNKGADPATRKANRERVRGQVEAVLSPAQRDQLHAAMKANRRRPS